MSGPGEVVAVRERILDAARSRFGRFGVRRTTIEEVAREAGLARATVYLHFAGKRELYRELLAADSRRLLAEIETAMAAAADALGAIRALFRVTLAHYAASRPLAQAAAEDGEMALLDEAGAMRGEQERRIVGLIAAKLEQGMREGTIRRVQAKPFAYLMFHAGRDLVDGELTGSLEVPFDRMMRALGDLVGHGILKS